MGINSDSRLPRRGFLAAVAGLSIQPILAAPAEAREDDSEALQRFIDNLKKPASLPAKLSLLKQPLRLRNGLTLTGGNLRAVGPIEALLIGDGVENVTLSNLTIDAAADQNGAFFGIIFRNGSGNLIQKCSIQNTIDAGISVSSEKNTQILDNTLKHCGRAGRAENHGITAYSITGTDLSGITIRGNSVLNAFRKGITTYSAGLGQVRNVTIESNSVFGCNTGGIFCAGAPGANFQDQVRIIKNETAENYVNILVDHVRNSEIADNSALSSTDRSGMEIHAGIDVIVERNTISRSATRGILITTGSQRVTISDNVIADSNQSKAGFAPDLDINDGSNINISKNQITSQNLVGQYSIYEESPSNLNIIMGNNLHSGKVKISGAQTKYVAADS